MPTLPGPSASAPVDYARRVIAKTREFARLAVVSVEAVAADRPNSEALGLIYDTRAELRHITDTLGDLLARFEDLS